MPNDWFARCVTNILGGVSVVVIEEEDIRIGLREFSGDVSRIRPMFAGSLNKRGSPKEFFSR